jgi:hypothetical protein
LNSSLTRPGVRDHSGIEVDFTNSLQFDSPENRASANLNLNSQQLHILQQTTSEINEIRSIRNEANAVLEQIKAERLALVEERRNNKPKPLSALKEVLRRPVLCEKRRSDTNNKALLTSNKRRRRSSERNSRHQSSSYEPYSRRRRSRRRERSRESSYTTESEDDAERVPAPKYHSGKPAQASTSKVTTAAIEPSIISNNEQPETHTTSNASQPSNRISQDSTVQFYVSHKGKQAQKLNSSIKFQDISLQSFISNIASPTSNHNPIASMKLTLQGISPAGKLWRPENFTVLKDDEAGWNAVKKVVGEKIRQERGIAKRNGEVVHFKIFVELEYEETLSAAAEIVENDDAEV